MKQETVGPKPAVAHRKQLRDLSLAQRSGLAVVSEGAALGVALFLERLQVRNVEVPLFLFAVALSAWFGRVGGAITALVLSTMAFDYFFTEPLHTLIISTSELPYFVVFASF